MHPDIQVAVESIESKIKEYKTLTAEELEQFRTELKEFKAKAGRSGFGVVQPAKGLRNEIQLEIHKAIHERKAEIIASATGDLMKPHEIKTVGTITTSNLSDTFNTYLDWRPGMEPTGQFHFRQLVRTMLSATDTV